MAPVVMKKAKGARPCLRTATRRWHTANGSPGVPTNDAHN